MDMLWKRLILLFLTTFSFSAYSQSHPSETGYACTAAYSQGGQTFSATAYAPSATDAAQIACNSVGGNYLGGFTCQGTSLVCSSAIAICLTGSGYEPADQNGFCPDPDPDEKDDEDGDGNDCDAGEEGTLDCTCEDGSTNTPQDSCPEDDRDGDGISDDEDDEDGVCDNDNEGDGDCDGICDAQDESGSEDCEEGDCPISQQSDSLFQPFDLNTPPFTPPSEVCATNKCIYQLNNCVESVNEPNIYACQGYSTGESCTICDEPKCTNNDCPEGTNRNSETDICEDIPNFCDLDEHTNGTQNGIPDGIPDNENTFACEEIDQCDPLVDQECDERHPLSPYECLIDQPPQCDGDPVECAIREESYRQVCGTSFEDPKKCEDPFKCEGDLYECASLELQHENYCTYQLTEEEQNHEDSLSNFKEGIDDGDNWFGRDGSDGSFVDLANINSQLDKSGYGFPRSCLVDQSVTWRGQTVDLNLSQICYYLDLVAYVVLLIAGYISFRIVGDIF